MKDAIGQWLEDADVPQTHRVTLVELETLDDYGSTIMIQFPEPGPKAATYYDDAIGSATAFYAEDLQRLGYNYVALQLVLGSQVFAVKVAKVSDWTDWHNGDLTDAGFNERYYTEFP